MLYLEHVSFFTPACPVNTYKSGVNRDKCQQCPGEAITIYKATTSIDYCICEGGSSESDEGTCIGMSLLFYFAD